jgi:hypothetical protein
MRRTKAVPKGERMIEVRLKFFTDELSGRPGYIVPGYCWDHGVVVVSANQAHEVKVGGNPLIFHTLDGIPDAVTRALHRSGVTLVPGYGTRKRYGLSKHEVLAGARWPSGRTGKGKA